MAAVNPNTPPNIRFQNAYGIEIRMEDYERKHSEISITKGFLLSILTPKTQHPLFQNIELYHTVQNVNVIDNDTCSFSFTVYILYDVPIEMIRGKTGDEIQQMLIPHAREIANLEIEGPFEDVEYKVVRCVLDNIVICDDIMEEENEEILWIWNLANDIARSPCSESKYSESGELTLHDEIWDLPKEPEE